MQNGGVGRSKVNIGRLKVNTLFFQQNQVGQRSTQVGQRSPNWGFFEKIIWYYKLQEKQLGRSKVTTHPRGEQSYRSPLTASYWLYAVIQLWVELDPSVLDIYMFTTQTLLPVAGSASWWFSPQRAFNPEPTAFHSCQGPTVMTWRSCFYLYAGARKMQHSTEHRGRVQQ